MTTLTHIQDNDYRLEQGTCWIEIGDLVLYLAKRPACLVYELYDKGCEGDSPRYSALIPYNSTSETKEN
jgi:hypothetical protein